MTAPSLLLTIVAALLLAANVTYVSALYWVHVVRPAPVRRGNQVIHL